MQGMPQNSIAEKVGVSANTIGKWAKDGCWGEKRAAMTITRKSLQNELLSAIKRQNRRTARPRHFQVRQGSGSACETVRYH